MRDMNDRRYFDYCPVCLHYQSFQPSEVCEKCGWVQPEPSKETMRQNHTYVTYLQNARAAAEQRLAEQEVELQELRNLVAECNVKIALAVKEVVDAAHELATDMEADTGAKARWDIYHWLSVEAEKQKNGYVGGLIHDLAWQVRENKYAKMVDGKLVG